MKFVDANIFVYAYYVPKRKLSLEERKLKRKARNIITKIDEGEEVATSAVHLSEVSNLLQRCYSHQELADLLKALYFKDNVKILSVSDGDYLIAIDMSDELHVGTNDCLAIVLMEKEDISDIYTFDSHFHKFERIKVLQ